MGVVAPAFIVAVVLYQGSSIMNPYWSVFPKLFLPLELTSFDRLVLWQWDSLGLSRGTYVSLALFPGPESLN